MFAIALFVTSGCSRTLTSPPARLLHVSSPESAGKGNTLVTGAFAAGGEVFGPGVLAGEAQVRHGVGESTDLGISGMAVGLRSSERDEYRVQHHAGIYALRAFTHHELVPRWLSLHLGVGGGGSAGGGYFASDFGFTFGYENPHLVPYAHVTGLASAAISPNTLDMTRLDETTLHYRMPYSTLGFQAGVGLRIPLGPRPDPFGSILLELTNTALAGSDPSDDDGFVMQRAVMAFGIAYQARFGRKEPYLR